MLFFSLATFLELLSGSFSIFLICAKHLFPTYGQLVYSFKLWIQVAMSSSMPHWVENFVKTLSNFSFLLLCKNQENKIPLSIFSLLLLKTFQRIPANKAMLDLAWWKKWLKSSLLFIHQTLQYLESWKKHVTHSEVFW